MNRPRHFLLFTILIVSAFQISYASDGPDPYIAYRSRYSHWEYSIHDYLESAPYGYSLGSAAYADQHNDSSEINGVTVIPSETLFDVFMGIINVTFQSKDFVLRPMECFNPYAPIYQEPSSLTGPVCYVDYVLYIDNQFVPYDTFSDGMSQDQHKLNVIQVALPVRDQIRFSPGKHTATLIVLLKAYDRDRLLSESTGTMQFALNVLPCVDSCKISDVFVCGDNNTILPPLMIYVTPIQVKISHPDGIRMDRFQEGEEYYWELYDAYYNITITDSYSGDVYFDRIPEYIRLGIMGKTDERCRIVKLFRLKRDGDSFIPSDP